jgi:hypothetical protein
VDPEQQEKRLQNHRQEPASFGVSAGAPVFGPKFLHATFYFVACSKKLSQIAQAPYLLYVETSEGQSLDEIASKMCHAFRSGKHAITVHVGKEVSTAVLLLFALRAQQQASAHVLHLFPDSHCWQPERRRLRAL